MKRLIVGLIILQLVQFVYIMGQIQIVKDVVTRNADVANERAEAFAEVLVKHLEAHKENK